MEDGPIVFIVIILCATALLITISITCGHYQINKTNSGETRMEIMIEETGEKEDIYINDNIENQFFDDIAVYYNDDEDVYVCPQECFDFWEMMNVTYYCIDLDLEDLTENGIWERNYLDDIISECYDNDFESTIDELLSLIERLQEERTAIKEDIEKADVIFEENNGLAWTDFNYHSETIYKLEDKYILHIFGGALNINGEIIKYINEEQTKTWIKE